MQEVEQLAGSSEKGEGEKKVENNFPSLLQTFRNGSKGRGQGLNVEGRVSSSKPSALGYGYQDWVSTPFLSLPWHISHSVPLLKPCCSLWPQKRVNVTRLASSLCSLLLLPESYPSCVIVSSKLKFFPVGKLLKKEGKQLKKGFWLQEVPETDRIL